MRQIRFVLAIPVIALGLVAAGCGGGGSAPAGSVAKVGDTTISQGSFDKLMDRAKQSYKTNNQKFPKAGTSDYDRIKSQAVSFLVQRAEFAQEADKMGITITEKQIDDRIQQIIKQYFNGKKSEYEAQIKKQHLSEQDVRDDVKNQLLSQQLYNKITADVKVSDQAVKDYYNSHITQYRQAQSRDVRHILISVCGGSTPAGSKCLSDAKAKAQANQLYDQLQAVPRDKQEALFSSLAKKYSQDPGSASVGGKLTVTQGQFVAPFEQTSFLLGKGTISRPVKTQYGYHLIMPIGELKAAHTTPFKDVKQAIYQQLLQNKKQQKMADWVKNLDKEFHVSYASGYAPASTSTSGTSTVSTTQPATTNASTTTTG